MLFILKKADYLLSFAVQQSWDPVGEVDPQDDRLHALDGQALLHHALNHRPCQGDGRLCREMGG
jgi:hypothetical protein